MNMRIGGKVSQQSGFPVELHVKVGTILVEPDATLPGEKDVWLAVKSDSVEIVLTNVRSQVFTPDIFTQVGNDPTARGIMVVKSRQRFLAGFDPIASEIIYCETPGTPNSDLASMPFKRIPRPMWSLDDIPENEF